MAKVGRNDPCPCGSGKKYKNCCLRQDRISESRELSLRGEEAVLLGLLYDYAQSPRFELSLVEAMNFYWGGVYDWRELPDHVEVDDLRRMIEWFVHDYRTGEERRYVIDLFAEERGVTLEPRVREVLEAWSRSAMGLFRVLEITDGRIRAYDPLREEELQIEDRSLARLARPGELLVGRLFELDGAKRLSLMTMLLPGAYETPLVEYVRNAYHRYQEEHYQATWDRFLRENGH
ncbi:MAG: SEC-C domain-containing protein, partial [Chloroflexi bacterium]|nr:SEC-C domain-containing protein [Chloroflexota bacterium]